MAKKQETPEVKEVIDTPIDNVQLAKQKILDHLHGKVKVDLQEIYNLL